MFFDNLSVKHTTGPLLEETHYYPFGLTMAGISYKALKPGYYNNKYKYNGIEQNNEFEINEYDARLRNLDPQTGRWWQVDPKIENMEMWSPYASNYDNPIKNSDQLGDEPEECCSGIITSLIAESVKNPNGAAAKTLGVVGGVGNFVNKTVSGAIGLVTSPPDLSLQGTANNAAQLGVGVADRINTIQNGSTMDATMAVTETVLDIASLAIGTKGIGAGLKAEAAVGVAEVGSGAAETSKGLGNPFKNATLGEVGKAFEKHVGNGKLVEKYTDPISGSKSYKNTKSGYSYNLDTGVSGKTGKKVEPAHVDVNYPNPKPTNVPPKKKLPTIE